VIRAADTSDRLDRVRESLAEQKLDVLLVSALPNLRYLTGFTGSNGMLAVSDADAVLFTDPRYQVQAAEQCDCEVRICRSSLASAVSALVRRRRWKRIGFESARLSFAECRQLQESFPPGAELAPAPGIVERLRTVKSDDEIDRIRGSVRLCSQAFRNALKFVRPGVREHELAAELDYQMRLLGAEGSAFETIVASGSRSALPHAQPTPKALNNNELLLIDMGAALSGYASDMTRMVHLGRPSRKVRRLHQAVHDAQLAALDAVRDGITAGYVDRRARGILRARELDSLFVHSTGHGLGLEIHEPPRIGKGEKTRLCAGMVITIEPGVYIGGFGGFRIEDTVVVTRSGCEVLTETPKELLVV
jgi:Xaa-Pro aminopeptidase